MTESDVSSESIRISVGSSIAGIFNTVNTEFKTQYKPKWTGNSIESVSLADRTSQTDVARSSSEESRLINRLKLGKWGESSQDTLPLTESNPFQTEAVPSEDDVVRDLKEVFPSFSRSMNSTSNETPHPMWTESLHTINTMDHVSIVYCRIWVPRG